MVNGTPFNKVIVGETAVLKFMVGDAPIAIVIGVRFTA
jgi:hypothetical protein